VDELAIGAGHPCNSGKESAPCDSLMASGNCGKVAGVFDEERPGARTSIGS
jgi:hypothetical protein